MCLICYLTYLPSEYYNDLLSINYINTNNVQELHLSKKIVFVQSNVVGTYIKAIQTFIFLCLCQRL